MGKGKTVHRLIMRAARRVIKRTKCKGIGNRWWGAMLTVAKNSVYTARWNFKGEQNVVQREGHLRVL
jgi:hypothetical protein